MKTNNKLIIPIFFILVFSLLINSSYSIYYGDGGESIKDATAISSNPDSNNGNNIECFTGYNTGYRRPYIEFNSTNGDFGDYVYIVLYGNFQQFYQFGYRYADFKLYEVDEDWNETDLTWNNKPSLRPSFDTINVTVHPDTSDFYLYLDITDSWNDFVSTSFADYYGYAIIMEKYNDYAYFVFDSLQGTNAPYLFFSQIELNTDGEPIGTTDDSESDILGTTILDFMLYGFFFVAIPVGIAVYIGSILNPTLGLTTFLGAETLMGAICLKIGFIDIWFMLVLIIIDILIIIVMIKGSGRLE